MDEKNGNSPHEEGKDMSVTLENKKSAIQEMLDRISSKADKLTGRDNMIELNPKNSQHKEWFEED